MTKSEVYDILKKALSQETTVPTEEITGNQTFFELGLDSVTSIFVMERIENELKLTLNPIDFWDYPTIDQYAARLYDLCQHGSR